MIFVGGSRVDPSDTQSSSSQAEVLLMALLEHPVLESSLHSFKAIPGRKFSVSEQAGSEGSTQSKCVYVFQREYATVDPALVDLVGTDEATTCVGIVIRNRESGMISIAHMDSPDVVEMGLTQMLSLVLNHNSAAKLDVHLIGGFDDDSPKVWSMILNFVFDFKAVQRPNESSNLLNFLHCRAAIKLDHRVFILFLCASKSLILFGGAQKIFTFKLSVFLGTTPEKILREMDTPYSLGSWQKLPPAASSQQALTELPDAQTKLCGAFGCRPPLRTPTGMAGYLRHMILGPTNSKSLPAPVFSYRSMHQLHMAMALRHRSDAEILRICSTSPSAEAPDFLDNLRRCWEYLIHRPDWRDTFPMKQPRLFNRTPAGAGGGGGWARCTQESWLPTLTE